MLTKEDVMKILNLETADYDTLTGLSELQRRVEQAHGLLTEHKIRTATDRLSGENADTPLNVLSEIDAYIDDKRIILKNAEIDLTPIAWEDIEAADRRAWLIPNWLPENTVTMFTGQGGAGKSWLTLQIICQIAGGFSEWAALQPDRSSNSDPTPTHNVILATYEDEPAEIKRRLHTLASGMQWIQDSIDTIKKHLHIVDMRGIGSIWGPGMGNHIANTGDLLTAGEALQRICEEKQAKLLVIDPLSGAFGGNENDRTAVYDFISSFRRWGDTEKCAILVVGHLPKYDGHTARFSGSTAWEAAVRSMWMLSTQGKDDETYWELSHTKSNYAPLQDDIPLIKSKYGGWKKAASEDDAIEGYKNYKEKFKEDTDEYGYDNIKL